MTASDLRDALQGANEVDLTVTGRKSGNESSRPIWFVEDGDRLLLLPVSGFGQRLVSERREDAGDPPGR
jgi:hypothetical protein